MLPVPRGHNAVLFWLSYAPDGEWSFRPVLTRRHPRYKGGVLPLNYGSKMEVRRGVAPRFALYESAASLPTLADHGGRGRILAGAPGIMSPPLCTLSYPAPEVVIAAGLSPATSAFAVPRSIC